MDTVHMEVKDLKIAKFPYFNTFKAYLSHCVQEYKGLAGPCGNIRVFQLYSPQLLH